MWADLELIVLGAGAGFCCGLAWVKSQKARAAKDVENPELFVGCRAVEPSVEASLEEILRILRRMDAQGIPVTDSMPGFAVGSLRGGDFMADQASLVARAEAMVRDGALPENWRELYGEPVAGNVIGQPRGLRFEGHFASWPSPPAARPATGSASQEMCRSAPDLRSAS